MKKIIAIAIAALCFGSSIVFAQDAGDPFAKPQNLNTVTVVPENQHVTNKTASVKLEYTEITNEVIAYYKILSVSYKEDEAQTTVRDCIEDFKNQNGYLKATPVRTSKKTKHNKDEKGIKWATYEERYILSGRSAF